MADPGVGAGMTKSMTNADGKLRADDEGAGRTRRRGYCARRARRLARTCYEAVKRALDKRRMNIVR